MNIIRFIIVLIFTLSFSSCGFLSTLFNKSPQVPSSDVLKSRGGELKPEEIENRCLSEGFIFRENADDNLYGLDCIEGKVIHIRTLDEGELVSTTTSAGET